MMTEYLIEWLRSESQLTIFVSIAVFAAYIVTSFLFIPRAPVLMATGAAFGWHVLPIIIVGANLGCILAFLAARYVAAKRFQEIVRKNRLSRAVASAVDREGWRIVALVRFAGPLPAGLASYAFGLSNIGFGSYSLCTVIFCAPAIVFYTYLGSAGRSALVEDGAVNITRITFALVVIVVCLIFWLVARATRIELAADTPADNDQIR